MKCARCKKKECYEGKECVKIKEEILPLYEKPELFKITEVATFLEGKYYMQLTRLEEIIRFAKLMGYRKIGIAFCIGFSYEARVLEEILEKHFEVSSVCCKVCGIDKKRFHLEQIRKDIYEAMCNPLGQAGILNREKTDLNIILGLCVGHDILFTKYSKAPVTTFAVKDRVLAHNTLGAIYSGYYRKKF